LSEIKLRRGALLQDGAKWGDAHGNHAATTAMALAS
jgi:hypothetical protein